jgi:hypothetical protein
LNLNVVMSIVISVLFPKYVANIHARAACARAASITLALGKIRKP